MDGLITKMQIAGADSKSICRELINGIDEERQMMQREKKILFNSTKTDQNELITYVHT